MLSVHKQDTSKHCEMRESSAESQQIACAPRRPGNTLEPRVGCFNVTDTFQEAKELCGGNLCFSKVLNKRNYELMNCFILKGVSGKLMLLR